MILKNCTECKNIIYFAKSKTQNRINTGYIIGKKANDDSRYLLKDKPRVLKVQHSRLLLCFSCFADIGKEK